MFEKLYSFLDYMVGINIASDFLTAFHLISRFTLIYVLGIILVRLQRQFMGINTPFNYMINFTLGSLLASAIVGNAPYFPILGMTLFILSLNYIIAYTSYHSKKFETFIKGKPELLVKDGIIQWKGMRHNLITQDELMDSIHKITQSKDLSKIKEAYFENSGSITIITK